MIQPEFQGDINEWTEVKLKEEEQPMKSITTFCLEELTSFVVFNSNFEIKLIRIAMRINSNENFVMVSVIAM